MIISPCSIRQIRVAVENRRFYIRLWKHSSSRNDNPRNERVFCRCRFVRPSVPKKSLQMDFFAALHSSTTEIVLRFVELGTSFVYFFMYLEDRLKNMETIVARRWSRNDLWVRYLCNGKFTFFSLQCEKKKLVLIWRTTHIDAREFYSSF